MEQGRACTATCLILLENWAKEIIFILSLAVTNLSSPALEWSVWESLALLFVFKYLNNTLHMLNRSIFINR